MPFPPPTATPGALASNHRACFASEACCCGRPGCCCPVSQPGSARSTQQHSGLAGPFCKQACCCTPPHLHNERTNCRHAPACLVIHTPSLHCIVSAFHLPPSTHPCHVTPLPHVPLCPFTGCPPCADAAAAHVPACPACCMGARWAGSDPYSSAASAPYGRIPRTQFCACTVPAFPSIQESWPFISGSRLPAFTSVGLHTLTPHAGFIPL